MGHEEARMKSEVRSVFDCGPRIRDTFKISKWVVIKLSGTRTAIAPVSSFSNGPSASSQNHPNQSAATIQPPHGQLRGHQVSEPRTHTE